MTKNLWGWIVAILLAGCGGGGGGPAAPVVPVQAPPNAAEVWQMAQPSEVGMDGALLNRALSELPSPAEHGMASMLVLRHGKPVLEQYWNGSNKDTLHDLRSATKSVTSLLMGAAIDRQLVAGVAAPIATYLSAAYPAAPALKQGITIEQVLTMNSGLACDDRDPASPGNEDKMYNSTDWVGFILSLPLRAAPGSDPHYCTGGAVLMGRVIAETSKQAVPAFADAALFTPLGIANVAWADFDNHRQTDTGGHLRMRARDLAKLGRLVAQNGMWDGKQVISADWITRSTSRQVFIDDGWKYGYFWWLKFGTALGRQVTMHFAWGNGGQFIFVVPELDLVAVFTGENYNLGRADRPIDIMLSYVLPSVTAQ